MEDNYRLCAAENCRTFISALYLAGPGLPTPPIRFARVCLIAVGNGIVGVLAVKGYLPVYWPNLPEKLPKEKGQQLNVGSTSILDPRLQLSYWYRYWQQYYRRPCLLHHDLSGVLFLICLSDPHKTRYLQIRPLAAAQ